MDGDVLSLSCLNADYLLAAGSDKYVWLWCHMRGSACRLSSALQLAHASFSGWVALQKLSAAIWRDPTVTLTGLRGSMWCLAAGASTC